MADVRVAPLLPNYGWLDRSEVYHDIKRRTPRRHGPFLYWSPCGCVFVEPNVGNKPPAGRRLCKWCERISERDAAIAAFEKEESDA